MGHSTAGISGVPRLLRQAAVLVDLDNRPVSSGNLSRLGHSIWSKGWAASVSTASTVSDYWLTVSQTFHPHASLCPC